MDDVPVIPGLDDDIGDAVEEGKFGAGYVGSEIKDCAPVDRKFERVELWEGKELPIYDGRGAGPCNLPPNKADLGPLDFFLLLFPMVLVECIVTQTNLYYVQLRKQGDKLEPLLTVREFFVWVGLHIKMVNQWSRNQDSYWDGSGSFDARVFMSRRRFYWIKQHLHFNDKTKKPPADSPDYDDVYPLRPVVDMLNATFRKYWKLSDFLSLDEMMVSFKGRNPLHRFIPRKPHPNGLKLHAVCDAVLFFCVAFLVDDNSSKTIPFIARTLFAGVVVPGMTVVTDRYYTCTGLVQLCLSRRIGLIGSTMTQRFLAKNVLTGWSGREGKARARGYFEVATNTTGDVACVCWKDKGVVRLTLTTSSTCRTTLVRRQSGMPSFLVRGPLAVKVFDAYFHGVDRNDQLRGNGYGLSLTFRAKKWTVKLFLGLLDVAFSNAWIIWRYLHPKEAKKHREWFTRLADDMLRFGETKVDEREMKVGAHRLRRLSGGAKRPMVRCPMCSTPKAAHRTTFGCPECQVGLHQGECAQRWHALTPEEQRSKRRRVRKLEFQNS